MDEVYLQYGVVVTLGDSVGKELSRKTITKEAKESNRSTTEDHQSGAVEWNGRILPRFIGFSSVRFREPARHAGNGRGLEYHRVPESEQSGQRIVVTRPDGWLALSAARSIGLDWNRRCQRQIKNLLSSSYHGVGRKRSVTAHVTNRSISSFFAAIWYSFSCTAHSLWQVY